jgi:hypothetical protein
LCIQESDGLPKPLKSFRFNPQTYNSFKELASQNGYTATSALEKFMETALQHGLVFPSAAKTQDTETETRILLAWMAQGRYWYNITGEKELSTVGRLLQLLPMITNEDLRQEIEESLKKKP